MTDALNEAEARAKCADLIAGFAYYVDNRQFDRAVQLFARGGIFERPDLKATGHDEIAAIWSQRPPSVITRHLCFPPFFLDVSDNRVKSVTSFTLYMVSHEGDGLPHVEKPTGIAEFHDEFTLEGGEWRIAHRKALPVLMG